LERKKSVAEEIVKFKGAAWKPITEFVKMKFGEDGFRRVLESVSPECREIASAKILVNSWYDLRLVEEFIAQADRVLGTGDLGMAGDMGRYSAEFGIKTIYKIFMKVGTPEFVLKRCSTIWKRYYSRGEMKLIHLEPGHVIVRLTDMGIVSRVLCARVTGWMKKTLAMTGAKGTTVEHTVCTSRGDPHCEWQGRWH
jgi:hypothetical protein